MGREGWILFYSYMKGMEPEETHQKPSQEEMQEPTWGKIFHLPIACFIYYDTCYLYYLYVSP